MFLKQFFKKKLMDNAMDTNYFRSNSFCKETTGLLEKKLIFVCSTIVSGGKKWVLAPLAIQPETKYHLFASWCHLLLSASLKSLQAEEPQTSRALSSAFSRGSCWAPGNLLPRRNGVQSLPPSTAHHSSPLSTWEQQGCFGTPKFLYGEYHTLENCGEANSMVAYR